MDELSRTEANTDDAFTLTADEALLMYEQAGHPRTLRSIQKFCKRGDIECRFEQTLYGRRYRISPLSVTRHIKELDEISAANDETRTDATVRMVEVSHATGGAQPTNGSEPSRPYASVRLPETLENARHEQPRTEDPVRSEAPPVAADGKYVALLERENEFLRGQITIKDHQIEQRDNQIQSMIERDRETNYLIQGLQKLLRLGSGERTDSSTDNQ